MLNPFLRFAHRACGERKEFPIDLLLQSVRRATTGLAKNTGTPVTFCECTKHRR